MKASQKRMILLLAGSWGLRYVGFVIMTILAVWCEARPAPHLSDSILEEVPFVPWVSSWNYHFWILAWAPPTFWLIAKWPKRACRLLYVGGVLSVVRGLCIFATGLGPVRGEDINAGMSAAARWEGISAIANPFHACAENAAFEDLTKDLFVSGHIATTFLVLLYVWPHKFARSWALIAHILVLVSVYLSHLHYTIDIIGAYAITFTLFVLMEKDPRTSTMKDMGPSWSEL